MKRSVVHSEGKTRTVSARKEGEHREAFVATDRMHPVESLHRAVGNQTVQRLVEARTDDGDPERRRRNDATEDSSPGSQIASVPLDQSLRGDGRRLDPRTRREMEDAFGRDFGDVRIHDSDGALAATRALDADAVATGTDIVMRPDLATFESRPGRLLLAHELAHVAQFEQSESGTGDREVSHRRDAAEREADHAAPRAAVGERVRVRETPRAPVATGVLDWLEERAEDVGSAASSAGSAVKSGASEAWEGAKSAGGAVKRGAETAWDVTSGVGSEIARGAREHGPFGMIYRGMKTNAGYVQQGGRWLEGQIDTGQDWIAEKARTAADAAEGIPVAEQLADAGAWSLDQYTQFHAGVLQGGTTLASGLVGMAANPVDAAKGLFEMGKHASFGPGITNPLKTAEATYDLFAGNEDLGTVTNRLFNPAASMEENAQFWSQVGSGIVEDYKRSIGEDGDYVQAVGRAGLDIGSLFLGGGGAAAKAGGTGGRVAMRATTKAGRGSRGARTAGSADVARGVRTTTDDTLRVSGSGTGRQAKAPAGGSASDGPPTFPGRKRGSDPDVSIDTRSAKPEFDWSDVLDDLDIPREPGPEAATATNRWERIDAAVKDAERAGFMKPGGQPGTVDAAFFPYKRAPQMRKARGLSSEKLQGAHLNPDAAMKRIGDVGWKKGEGLSMGLDETRHTAMDDVWKEWSKAQRRAGRTEVPVAEWQQKLFDAVEEVGGLERRTKDAMQNALFHELYGKHGLGASDKIVLPYPNVKPTRGSR